MPYAGATNMHTEKMINMEEGEDLPTDLIRQRAIGVVYDPKRERMGNYVPSMIPLRYDALIYLDETTAIHPLHFAPHDEKIPKLTASVYDYDRSHPCGLSGSESGGPG